MTGFGRPAAIPPQPGGWELRRVDNGQTVGRFDLLADAFEQQVVDHHTPGKPVTAIWHMTKRNHWQPHPTGMNT